MSFKETDFTGLMGYLKGLLATQKDPILFREMVSKLVEFYEQLPVYPGIVNMCLGQAQKVVEVAEVKKGQKVFLSTSDGYLSGTVEESYNGKISLKDVFVASDSKTIEVDVNKISKVVVINENVVKELWPSLVFDKE